LPSAQEKYFYDISENYVQLLFTEVTEKDIRYGYRNSFFKGFADLLAMSVYTIFVTCFPESYLTQFTESFKDFICFVSHLWISGCKPSPRSFTHWNFSKIDPPSANFAKEVLNNTKSNIVDEIKKIGTAHSYYTPSKAYSRSSQNSSLNMKKSSSQASINRRRLALM
jgi:hypothetical protein